MSRSNLVDVEVIIVHQTDKAVLVKSDEEADGVWLPLSQCEVDGEPGSVGGVTLPDWLATEKELI